MILRTLLIFAVSIASVSAAPVPKELKRSTEIERMQGVWKEEKGMRWFFDGEKLYVGGTDTTGNKGKSYALTLRPGARSGRSISAAGKSSNTTRFINFSATSFASRIPAPGASGRMTSRRGRANSTTS